MHDESILEPFLEQEDFRRRKLLPGWIKVFIWFFMVAAAMIPIIFIASIAMPLIKPQMAIYGFETNSVLSLTGLFITALFLFKGIVSIGLWTEKDWAISLAQVDAILGIGICAFAMFVLPFVTSNTEFTFRLELVALIPYFITMQKIRRRWLGQ